VAPPGLGDETNETPGVYTLVSPNETVRIQLQELGHAPQHAYDLIRLLDSARPEQPPGSAVVIDFVSWARQAKDSTSKIARSVSLLLRQTMSTGGPAVYLVRMNAPISGMATTSERMDAKSYPSLSLWILIEPRYPARSNAFLYVWSAGALSLLQTHGCNPSYGVQRTREVFHHAADCMDCKMAVCIPRGEG